MFYRKNNQVIDGDTVIVGNVHVRLALTSTPELDETRTVAKVYCGDVMLNSAILENNLGHIDTRFCSQSEFSSEV